MNSIPPKILLSYHLITRTRLSCASLPYGKSMTKWINDAICEKLDREQPETIGVVPLEPVKAINPMESREKALKAARKPDFFGPWTVEYGENKTWRKLAELRMKEAKKKGELLGLEDALEIVAKGEGVTMSEDEGRDIMEAYRLKQLESAPPAAPDADFWGEDELSKVRSLVKTHAR